MAQPSSEGSSALEAEKSACSQALGGHSRAESSHLQTPDGVAIKETSRSHQCFPSRVILHEEAHQLDQESGSADGVPILERRSDYLSWARVFEQEYQKLLRDVEQGKKTVMARYGATDPAEFLAVATETFFEKPLLRNWRSRLISI